MNDLERMRDLMTRCTRGEWSVPHLSIDDLNCDCGYVFAEGQFGMGTLLTVEHGGENPPLNEAKANGELLVLAVNFMVRNIDFLINNSAQLQVNDNVSASI